MDINIIVFTEFGRVFIGNKVKEDDTTITVYNPAVVTLNQNPQKPGVEVSPAFLPELCDSSERNTTWVFQKASLAMGTVKLGPNLIKHYTDHFTDINQTVKQPPKEQPAAPTPEIKLFD